MDSMHRKLGSMADEYGPAFTIRLGSHKTPVVSKWELVKECFTTNDISFSNHPAILSVKLLFYGVVSGCYVPYGAYWRELRKFSLFWRSATYDTIMNGSDTLALTLTWAISLLLNHPDALKKALEELDTHVGKDRKVEESDIPNLTYIPAIIKETMRLYPVGPLSRSTVEDCEVGGYHVPAGTRLLVNLWKMQRDENVYKDDPLEFRPERFLTSNADVDLKGQHYELLPLGVGRRICPGVSMAVQLLHLILARVIHEFEITTQGKVDMSERMGFLFYKKMPLEVLIRPRLSGVEKI
ncbi:hypothetical protein MKW98_001778 [Papaver atlanticum]|uniref:Cytochrome P450 n=1 Tax=Papaver atlanticum TaxID=357466 RepID=A0AAD4X937_9MAGN|nr:hypothetical protein MKW98_001778 [Papaver atlanticum]